MQEVHLQQPAQCQECPSPTLNGAHEHGIVLQLRHTSVPTIPNASVALRHLSSEDGDRKVDWMNNFVSSDCEAWYMLTECLCLANALSDLNTLYTSSLVWENMTVLGIMVGSSVLAIRRAICPRSLCRNKGANTIISNTATRLHINLPLFPHSCLWTSKYLVYPVAF